MNDKQKVLFNLLKEIDEICRKHDITYYLDGGSLIGAMRHRGFLPWDDDIDITMPRGDWLRFIDVIKGGELRPDRLLEAQEINRDYMNVFGRYSDTSVTAIHKGDLFHGGGMPLDIFPLDPIPNHEAFKKYTENLLLYADIITLQNVYSYRYGINKDRYTEAVDRISRGEREAVLTELEGEMFKYDENECDFYALRFGSVPFLFGKDLFGSSRRVEFEGLSCSVPDKANDYLVIHFGDDWTIIPPDDDREVHNAIFDMGVDGTTFFNDYSRLIDITEERSKWQHRKEYLFDTMESRIHINKERVDARAKLKSIEINKKIEKFRSDISEAVKERDYVTLSKIFNEYYTAQFDKDMIGRQEHVHMQRFAAPALIDISDKYLYIAVITLINTRRIAKAYRLIQIRKQLKGTLTDELAQAEGTIVQYRKIISNYDRGLIQDALSSAEIMNEKNPDMLEIQMFLAKAYIETEQYEKANEIIKNCINKYPYDGYFKKYEGDYFLKRLGDIDSAVECYKAARETTNNGIVLLEINEIMECINEGQIH